MAQIKKIDVMGVKLMARGPQLAPHQYFAAPCPKTKLDVRAARAFHYDMHLVVECFLTLCGLWLQILKQHGG